MKSQVYFFPSLLTSLQLLQMLIKRIFFFFAPCLCWFSLHKKKQSHNVGELCCPSFWKVSPIKFLLIKDQVFIWNESQKTEMYLGYFNWFQEFFFSWAIQILLFVNNSPLNRWEIYKANLYCIGENCYNLFHLHIVVEKVVT